MSDKVTKEDIENQSFVNKLQNDMINLLGEERSAIEDIKSIERQLVKSKQDSLDATDQTVALQKASRDLADDLVKTEAAKLLITKRLERNNNQIVDVLKNKQGLTKKDLNAKLKELTLIRDGLKLKHNEIDLEADGIKGFAARIKKAQALNTVIQGVGDSFATASSGAIAIGDNLNSALGAVPGGAALAKLLKQC